ncbi:LPXTG cell wall anchor domain-containing protein [Streptococcus pluranimalium]|uniref:LPXTG cell wall anchor domain-containing protein n=1 Tax=Streptococcus pluranimalium TaxID=82348 RepID=UPI0039FC109D
MKKKQLLATLALSSLVLAQAGLVSADELTPVDASQPATELVTRTETSSSETVTDPSTPSTPQGKDDAGDQVGKEPSVSEVTTQPNKPAEESISSKPISEPQADFTPFQTPGGQIVIGTQNSQVIIQQADGSTPLVAPEAVGGTTNADGTVTLKAASGEVKTLPQTGDEAGSLLSFLGTSLLMGLGLLKKKKMI